MEKDAKTHKKDKHRHQQDDAPLKDDVIRSDHSDTPDVPIRAPSSIHKKSARLERVETRSLHVSFRVYRPRLELLGPLH
jgi:hypothetical protein